MRMMVTNLGPIEHAQIEIGDFTILCGLNNTGKTCITYAFYGFLFFWERFFNLKLSERYARSLLQDGIIKISIDDIVSSSAVLLERASTEYTKFLPRFFAQDSARFEKTKIQFKISQDEIVPLESHNLNFGSGANILFTARKDKGDNNINITLLLEKDRMKLNESSIIESMDIIIKEIVFSKVLPSVFLASTERTGAITFIDELDIKRNIYLRELTNKSNNDINPLKIEQTISASYPIPIREDVAFNRKISSLNGSISYVSECHPDVIDFYNKITGGLFIFGRDHKLFYKINKKKLNISEASSSIKSLLDIGMYLKYKSAADDFLIIDEPELNLHPENQRKLARLIIRLINIGIKVFITTHSDYIIKEINNIILVTNRYGDKIPKYLKDMGYDKDDNIDYKKIRVFKTAYDLVLMPGKSRKSRKQTIIPMRISKGEGINAETFDVTINEMNEIQDRVLFGED